MKKLSLVFVCLFLSFSLYADIPVVDLGVNDSIALEEADSEVVKDSSNSFMDRVNRYKIFNSKNNKVVNLSIDERLKRLEQQMEYLNQLELSNKVDKLQQMVQDLRGLIEVQGHELQELRDKQRELYEDLDNRVSNFSDKKKHEDEVNEPIKDKQLDDNEEVIMSDDELKDYTNAFNFVKDKKYSQAMINLHEYLKKYPNGKYSVNAHYWLGELFIISGEEERAEVEFNTVVNSNSNKVEDALLKLGMIAYDQSNYMLAKEKWSELIERYPDSSAARIANVRLTDLQKSGL